MSNEAEIQNNNIRFEIRQQKFKHKVTGEIVTQIPILKIKDYEKVQDEE